MKEQIKSIKEGLDTEVLVKQVIKNDFYSIKIDYKYPFSPNKEISLLKLISFKRGGTSVNPTILSVNSYDDEEGVEFPKN